MQDKDILEKAQELLEQNSQVPPLNPNREGSYEDETRFSKDRSLEIEEGLERNESHHETLETSNLGHQRFPRFKKPGFIKIIGGVAIIILLIILISMLMPYIPPQ